MGDLAALCPCGASEFASESTPPPKLDSVFTCAACGRRQTYGELLDSIGEQAIKRARDSLEALKREGGAQRRSTRRPSGKDPKA
ncbi:MAG TPA: hypothetical protein VM489_03015 [Burkholderiales bacterium]|nr:hypothetical protein [Burkholderiales bacterium]